MQEPEENLCDTCFWRDNDECFKVDRGFALDCSDYNETEQVLYDLSLLYDEELE